MLSAERYRTKANELRAEAQKESDPVLRLNCERLAVSYERLADPPIKMRAPKQKGRRAI